MKECHYINTNYKEISPGPLSLQQKWLLALAAMYSEETQKKKKTDIIDDSEREE